MQFSIIFLMVVAALVSTSEACKCVLDGASYPTATGPCCAQLDGDFNSSDGDCAAGSISDHLSNVRLLQLMFFATYYTVSYNLEISRS